MVDAPEDAAKAERIARIVAQAERDVVDCAKCGIRHLAATPCLTARNVKKAEVVREGDPVEKWKALADRAKTHTTVYQRTGRKCPGCSQDIFSGQNVLGVWVDVIGPTREYLDEHQAVCCKPITRIEEPVELVRPERPRRDLD